VVELLHLSVEEVTAVRLSLRVAFWAMTASLIPGILLALVLARGRFWGKALLDGLIHLPLVMPPVVTGYLLLLLLGRKGPLGQFLDEHFGIVFAFRWTGAALACAVMGFPLMVRAIRLSIEAVDSRLEDAAATLGAGPVWVFLVVTLPLTLPGIIAGMILSFARSMGEFGATNSSRGGSLVSFGQMIFSGRSCGDAAPFLPPEPLCKPPLIRPTAPRSLSAPRPRSHDIARSI
jgi:molybdate transport system permease protein